MFDSVLIANRGEVAIRIAQRDGPTEGSWDRDAAGITVRRRRVLD